MRDPDATRPNWGRLFEIAAGQAGYFTTKQAAHAGYSTHLLRKHIRSGRVARAQRGVYRLVHFPASEHGELATAWLWSEQVGVMSHQTALALHGLSDALPAHLHLTLPAAWQQRRLRIPEGVIVYYGDVPREDRVWFGPVPATGPRRTLADCAKVGLSPELLLQAARQALDRGLVERAEISDVELALAPFGGLDT